MSDLRRARLRFRAARHRLAAAALAGDPRECAEAAWALLRSLDRLRAAVRERPSRRDVRQWWRWRRWALRALRREPPAPGLLHRARWLQELEQRRNDDDGRT